MKSSHDLSELDRRREPKPIFSRFTAVLIIVTVCAISLPTSATTVLLNQDFESPVGFMDTTGRDVSQQSVNDLYGNQPPGFTYAQQFTVETLEITGD